MIYITSDNKIMRCSIIDKTDWIEITNDTYYVPLCIYRNIVLLSNYKLYIVTYEFDKLIELVMTNGEDYKVDDFANYYPGDFTDTYVKINSEFYKIKNTRLHKISIVASNSSEIIKRYKKHEKIIYYVSKNNKLIIYNKKDNSRVTLDENVDSIFFVTDSGSYDTIIYKKTNAFLCSTIIKTKLCSTYVIDVIGSTIIKKIGRYALDSDNSLRRFTANINGKYRIQKASDIIDFNIFFEYVYTINADQQILGVCANNNCYLKKKISNTKSAISK
jgi:hypothetical protein